jgi:hypothetical protein
MTQELNISLKDKSNDDALFITNEMTKLDDKELKNLTSNFSFLNIFHCNTLVDLGQETYSYNVYDAHVEAKENTKDSKDIPFVGANGKQFTAMITNIGCAIAYTRQDLLAPKLMQKRSLSILKNDALNANLHLINKLCLHGNKKLGINGLFSDENIKNKKSVVKIKGKTEWKHKTNDEVLRDLMDAHSECMEATNNLITPDTLLISWDTYFEIALRAYDKLTGETILQKLESLINVKVRGVHELNNAFQGGKDGFIYFKNNPNYVEQLVPSFFNAGEPIKNMNGFEVGCFSRYGGLIIRQPKMFAMRYGI